MGRRAKRIPTALSQRATSEAANGILTARRRVIEHTTHFDRSFDWIVKQLFQPGVRTALRAGWAYCTDGNKIGRGEYQLGENVILDTSQKLWDDLLMLQPHHQNMLRPDERVPELMDYIREVRVTLREYAKVAYVFDWFSIHSNGATMRDYCPWVASLVSSQYQDEFLGRVTEPAGLGQRLPLIREAAGIIASGLLVQGDPPVRVKHGYSLQFGMTFDTIHDIRVPIASYDVAL